MCDFNPKVRSQILAPFSRNVFYRLSLKLLISLALPFFFILFVPCYAALPFLPSQTPAKNTSTASANTVSGVEMTKHIKVKFELQRPDS